MGRQRHRAGRRSAHRRRRGQLLPAAARHRPVHVLVRAAHRRHVRRDGPGPGRRAGRGAEGRRPRRHARGQPPRLAGPGLPGGRGQRRRRQVSDADRVRHPGPAARRHRPAGPPDGGVRLPWPAAGRRSAVPGRQRPGRPGPLPGQRGRRRAARPDERRRAADPQPGTRAATRSASSTIRRSVRRTATSARTARAEILLDLSVYGEGQPAANLCGRMFRPLRHGRLRGEQPVRLRGQPDRQRPAAGRGLSPGRRLDAAGQPDRRRRAWTPPRPRRAGAGRRRRPGPVHRDGGVRRAEPPRPGRHAAQPGDETRRHPARLRRGGPAQPGRRLAPAGRRARRAARPGHGRPARGHRRRLQRARPAASRSATATGPARPTPTTRRPSG